jgi:EF hand
MRNVTFLRALARISAIAVTGLFAGAAFGGTVHLGYHSQGQIEMACGDAPGGQYTSGTGPGGYGCKTSKGEVSCTSGGDCTGTCSNCSDRVIQQSVVHAILGGVEREMPLQGGSPGMMGNPVMMRMMFALTDADGDGTISLQEFHAAHERIFKAMDTDKDGPLTLEEIQAFHAGAR